MLKKCKASAIKFLFVGAIERQNVVQEEEAGQALLKRSRTSLVMGGYGHGSYVLWRLPRPMPRPSM